MDIEYLEERIEKLEESVQDLEMEKDALEKDLDEKKDKISELEQEAIDLEYDKKQLEKRSFPYSPDSMQDERKIDFLILNWDKITLEKLESLVDNPMTI